MGTATTLKKTNAVALLVRGKEFGEDRAVDEKNARNRSSLEELGSRVSPKKNFYAVVCRREQGNH